MTISGTSFSTTTSENTVTVGRFPVTASSSSAIQLLASVVDLPAGTHVVDVFVSGFGYATGTFSHTVAPTITAVSPVKSSVSGGVSVTITGTGFDYTNPAANRVELCQSDCAVTSATATSIICTSGALVTSATADIGEASLPWNLQTEVVASPGLSNPKPQTPTICR
jgi:hypothetical protein